MAATNEQSLHTCHLFPDYTVTCNTSNILYSCEVSTVQQIHQLQKCFRAISYRSIRLHPDAWPLALEHNTVDFALLSRWLSGAAIILGHFGQEWNHTNSSVCKTPPVNWAKDFAWWGQCVGWTIQTFGVLHLAWDVNMWKWTDWPLANKVAVRATFNFGNASGFTGT